MAKRQIRICPISELPLKVGRRKGEHETFEMFLQAVRKDKTGRVLEIDFPP